MNVLQAVILGLIQGLTEFLPVSSSGHLLLGSLMLGLPAPGVSLSLLLHIGTAFATVAMLWNEIVWVAAGVFAPKAKGERARSLTIIGLIVLASIPGAIVGLFLEDLVDAAFGSGGVAALGLIITGFILRYAGRRTGASEQDGEAGAPRRRRRPRRGARAGGEPVPGEPVLSSLNLRRAAIVGLSQAVAIVPGISRSGTTIATGLHTGLSREDAARFSFLLALPAVFGGALLDFRAAVAAGEPLFTVQGIFGAVVAFISGVFALSAVFRVVRRGELSKFAYYCWAAGALSLIWLMTRGA